LNVTRTRGFVIPILLVLLLLVSCSPTPGQRQEASGQESSRSIQPQGPKILTIGLLREAATIDGYTGQGGNSGGAEMYPLLHDKLTVLDPRGVVQPQLAVEVPSIEKGTWEILPDRRMVMTWKLRQGVKWHDGTPFTSDDMMFALMLRQDRDLAHSQAAIARQMESAANPDPHTFVVTWRSVYVTADQAPALPPQPKHYLEELYRTDKEAFINSPKFREEYLGLGPYRMTGWDRGSQMDLARFDDYWRGRPPLDRIVIRFINDPNTLVANVLAEAVDLNVPPGITGDSMFEVQRRWEGTGNVARIEPVPILDYMEPMIRPEYARPANGLPQLAVRQALMHGLDRAALTEVITGGLGPPSDSFWFPNDALFPQIESAFVKYPYDASRARQLLGQAGWEPGPDGILVHRPSGERFELEIMVNETLAQKTGTIIAEDWKKLGVAATANPIPPARADDRAYTAQRPGPLATFSFGDWSSDRLNGRDLASEANRWSGRNRAGYQNPRSDAVLDALLVTIDPAARLPLLREQAQIYSADVAMMPLYWEVRSTLASKAVKADIRPSAPWWDPFAWDKEAS
jgi:peptide/nickel transport system substrate-binding protein